MAAKFLLLFVYIASVNNHSTVDTTLDAPPSRTTSEREIARARASVVGRATSAAAQSAAGGNGTAAFEREYSRHGHGSQPLEADGMGSMAAADGASRPCRTSAAVQTVVGTRVA